MKDVLIMFGGVSPEHEVSVITGLQVVETIDRSVYTPYTVYISKTGELQYLSSINDREEFLTAKRKTITFGRDAKGGYISIPGLKTTKIYPYSTYLAFHGGYGENGGVQGLLESMGIPYTSTSVESAAITMNKQLTKDAVSKVGVETIPGMNLFPKEIHEDSAACATRVIEELGLPVIIKPAHLGSSIGISVAKTQVELEKALLEASHVDSEILIEKFMTGFVEYNCSVRLFDGRLEASEIEKPFSQDEILSFADKYQRGGGKKTGAQSGMASLERELPARISDELKTEIQEKAKKAFTACRCKGMVRIDFMKTVDSNILLTEINPIPGSVAFYLWEATGIPFRQQITDLVEQSVVDKGFSDNSVLAYETDIIEKFVKNR